VLADAGQIDEPVDRAQQVICRHVILDAEAVEQCLLHHFPLAHHQRFSACPRKLNQDFTLGAMRIFSTE